MTANEYLQGTYSLTRGIRFKKERIQQLRELAESVGGSIISGSVKGSRKSNSLEDSVLAIEELEREIYDDVLNMCRKEREIRTLIEREQNPDYRQLLELRYLNGYTWERIADEMNYSYYHVVHRMYPKALSAIAKML